MGKTANRRNAADWYRRSLHLSTALPAIFCAVAASQPAWSQASVEATGDVGPFPSPNPLPVWTVPGKLRVGASGTGTLTIKNGGKVSNSSGDIGDSAGSNGHVTVTGPGSTWTSAEYLVVGRHGTGTLTIENGGEVSSTYGFIGYGVFDPGLTGSGNVTVSGAGSKWTNSVSLDVGIISGITGTLTIEKNGLVEAGFVTVGYWPESSGTINLIGTAFNGRGVLETAYVEKGAGSGTLNLNGGILRATRDESDFLRGFGALTAGADGIWIDSNGHDITVGPSTTFAGLSRFNKIGAGTLTLTGNSSAFAGHTTVDGGMLAITGGGKLGGFYGYIGNDLDSNGTVTVTGAGSTWTNTGTLNVGYSGDGTLTVSDSGTVSNSVGYIALNSDSESHATVTGAGSTWASTGVLFVGASGNGTLVVSDGGKVSNTGGYIGMYSGSEGYATVTGAGSTWTNTGDLAIGNFSNGTLTVGDSGTVKASSVRLGSPNAGATNSGTLNIGAAAGEAAVAAGMLDTASVQFRNGTGTLNFNHLGATTFDAALIRAAPGAHIVNHFAGITTLTGDSSAFTGTTTVSGGTLTVANALGGSASVTGGSFVVNGAFGGDVAARTGGVLTGSGHITGHADLTNGGVFAGESGQTLRVDGNVVMDATSTLNASLGAASSTALVSAGGNLALNGTLNVTDAGGFGVGVYRLIDYGGSLTGSGLTIGATPSGVGAADLSVQTAVAGRVNLISTAGAALGFWDGGNAGLHDNGAVDGGSGVWRADGRNWTQADGAVNGPSQPVPTYAVFQNVGGVVTVDTTAGAIGVTGMQFAADGYRVEGDSIALQGAGGTTTIRVGDGTQAGAGMTATIASALTGASTLVKSDYGTLILSGANSYTGGTQIVAGTLVGNAGSIRGDIANAGTVEFAQAADASFAGDITGLGGTNGAMVKSGAGNLTLTGMSSLDWTIKAGTLSTDASRFTGNAAVQASANLTFDQGGNATYAGILSGTGDFAKTGAGSLALTGDSSAFAGITTVSAGALAVNGRLGGDVAARNSGIVTGFGAIAGNADLTGGGVLAGTSGQTLRIDGNVVMDSSTVLSVALGAPSATGLFDVGGNLTLAGTLDVFDAGSFGAGVYRIFDYDGALNNQGMLIGGTPGGIDADSLSIQTADHGKVNLVSTSGMTLSFWDGGNVALHDNGVVNGGNGVWRSDGRNWTQADGTINGPYQPNPTFAIFQGAAGTVTVKAPAGDIAVAGLQFTTDGYRIEGDPIELQGAGGKTIINVGDHSTASAGMTASIASVLTGASTLVKSDDGTLILSGANSYTGGTQVEAGTLIGNVGSLRGDIGNAGTVVFDQTADASFAGNITGLGGTNGVMVKSGAGNLALAGTSSLDWTIKAGGLSTDASRFTGNAAIQASANLTFDQSANATYAGVLSSTGDFAKTGAGSLALTGDSSAFAGMTTVSAGILAVNGRLGGTISVANGGRLGGTGSIGNLLVNGTVAPGNSIGTLNVGSVTFNAGSIYQVEVNAAGQSDKIAATGTATINGGGVRVLAGSGNYAPQTRYMILTAAGGRTGTFTEDPTSNLAFLDPSLGYDANNVYLRMSRNDISFAGIGVTPNQIAAASGVESLNFGNPVYDAVLNLSAPQARGAFDALSGEIHASARTAMTEDSRFVRNAVNDRIRAAFDAVGASGGPVATYVDGQPRAVAANTDGLAVWGQGFGSWGQWNSDGNAAKLNRSIGGFFIGADAPAFDNWRFGAVAGYSRSRFDAKDRFSSGSSDNYHVGLYGGTTWGALSFRTGAAYTWQDISTSRSVAFPGFGDSLKGDYNAGTAQVFGEVGYRMQAANVAFEPFANLAYVNLHTGGFTEKGGVAALTSRSANTDTTFTTLGLRASTAFDLNGMAVTAKGTLGWRHAFGDVTPDSVTRFAAGGNAFSIGGVPITRDAAVVEAGLDLNLSPTAILGVSYGGQFGSGVTDQTFRASFNVKF